MRGWGWGVGGRQFFASSAHRKFDFSNFLCSEELFFIYNFVVTGNRGISGT
jgi:hypothetical protein